MRHHSSTLVQFNHYMGQNQIELNQCALFVFSLKNGTLNIFTAYDKDKDTIITDFLGVFSSTPSASKGFQPPSYFKIWHFLSFFANFFVVFDMRALKSTKGVFIEDIRHVEFSQDMREK